MTAIACLRPFVPFALLLCFGHAQEEPQKPLTTRVYDVRDVVRIEPDYQPATAIEASFVPTEREVREDRLQALDLGDAVTLAMMGSSPMYWEREGVELRPEDSGFLTVTCDAAMHQRVQQVLQQVRAMLFETVLVEVHEVPGDALDGRPSVLSEAMADGLLAQLGEHRVHFGRANVQRPLLLESKRTQNRIAGLGVRVAQGASAPQPEVATASYGSSWSVLATRTVGDALLVSVTGSDRALEESTSKRRVPTSNDDGPAVLEFAATRIATCHASAYLKPGQSMLVGTNAADGAALCIRVRRAGAPVKDAIGELRAFSIRPLIAGARPPAAIVLPGGEATLFPEIESEPTPAVCDDGRLMEAITSQVAPDSWDGDPNTLNARGGYLFAYTPSGDEVAEQVAALLQKLQDLDARQYSLEVRFGKVAADALRTRPDLLAEKLTQRCLATVSASRGAQVSATRHTPYVRDFGAVMASASAATYPEVGGFAEGFLMRGEIANSGQGTVRLDLHLTTLSRGVETQPFNLEHPRIGAIDRVDVRENKVRGVATVEVGEWTLLSVSPVEGGPGHVAVVVRVSSLQ
jgi:hypothetical protein